MHEVVQFLLHGRRLVMRLERCLRERGKGSEPVRGVYNDTNSMIIASLFTWSVRRQIVPYLKSPSSTACRKLAVIDVN